MDKAMYGTHDVLQILYKTVKVAMKVVGFVARAHGQIPSESERSSGECDMRGYGYLDARENISEPVQSSHH